jgi:nitrogen fixation NifU-like protein
VSDASELYQAVIVEHDRAPRNHGPLPGATHEATVDNPLCGDVVTMRAVVEGGVVRAVAFECRGCALARASGSIATTRALGATPAELRELASAFARFVCEAPDAPMPAGLGELAAFAGVRKIKSRRTCATLALRALVAALAGDQSAPIPLPPPAIA